MFHGGRSRGFVKAGTWIKHTSLYSNHGVFVIIFVIGVEYNLIIYETQQ